MARYSDIWTRDYVKMELRESREELIAALSGELPVESILWKGDDWIRGIELWASRNPQRYCEALRKCGKGHLLAGEEQHDGNFDDYRWNIAMGLHRRGLVDAYTESVLMDKTEDLEQLVIRSNGALSVEIRDQLMGYGFGDLWRRRVLDEQRMVIGGCTGCHRSVPVVANRPCGHVETCYTCYMDMAGANGMRTAKKCGKCDEIVVDYKSSS